MNQKFKRILNAFVSASSAAFLALVIEDYANLTNAISVGDWSSLKVVVFALAAGAINAGIRAIQASTAVLPSPEPEENP